MGTAVCDLLMLRVVVMWLRAASADCGELSDCGCGEKVAGARKSLTTGGYLEGTNDANRRQAQAQALALALAVHSVQVKGSFERKQRIKESRDRQLSHVGRGCADELRQRSRAFQGRDSGGLAMIGCATAWVQAVVLFGRVEEWRCER